MYDPKCDALARHFLEGQRHDEEDVAELSQQIQDVVEDWMTAFVTDQNSSQAPEE